MNEMYLEEEGMTLVETVLYVALFAIISLSVLTFTWNITEYNQEAESRTMVQRSLIQVQEHIAEKMEVATAIDELSSVWGVDAGVLAITVSGAGANYQISDGRLTYSAGGSSIPISSSKIVITRFYLEQVLDRTDQVTGVRVTLEVQSSDGKDSDSLITSFLL